MAALAEAAPIEKKFNGGKMRHIFATEADEKRDADSALTYKREWFCEEAKLAMYGLRDGSAKAFRKIDGSCGLIKRGPDGRWMIFQRYDDKKGKLDPAALPEDIIQLPDGENTRVYSFEEDCYKHQYFFKLLPRFDPTKREYDKKGRLKHITMPEQITRDLYNILDNAPTDHLRDPYYSVELVGPNFNRTFGVGFNTFAIHELQKPKIDHFPSLDTPDEWFAWLTDYFTKHRDEGLIISHLGRYWKIHGSKFVPDLPKNYEMPEVLCVEMQL